MNQYLNLNLSIKSTLLVVIQFSCIGFLVFTCKYNQMGASAIFDIAISILLAFWSIYTMQKSKLRIFPEPSIDAILITDGPYRYIRHPMYTSVLLGCLGLVLIQFNLIRLAIFGLLVLNLLFKLHWEETMLKRKFDDYRKYCADTFKLVPFIY